uniref:Protein TsetseEP domain-containing protein n=1 Tax=Anopheles farauti TaxID=69004 RepID=A0A182QQI2_9DIPT
MSLTVHQKKKPQLTMKPRIGYAFAIISLLVGTCSAKPNLPAARAEDSDPLEGPPFLADLRDMCRNATGSDRSFNELKDHISTDLPKCFMAHVNLEQLKTDTTKLEEQDKKKLFEIICEQIHESATCLTPVQTKLKPCLNEEDVKVMDQVVATMPEALNMACANSGALLQKFTEPAYRSCAMELPAMIEECTSELPDSMEKVPFSQYSEKQCGEIYNMRDCFSRRITECGATGYMDFFILFYRKLLALTPCK